MGLLDRFKRKPEHVSLEAIDEARARLPMFEALVEQPGWVAFQTALVELSNEAVQQWMAGVDHDRSLQLASRVSTLGEALQFVDSQIALYRMMLATGGMEEGTDPDSEGTTPFMAPQEDVRD